VEEKLPRREIETGSFKPGDSDKKERHEMRKKVARVATPSSHPQNSPLETNEPDVKTTAPKLP